MQTQRILRFSLAGLVVFAALAASRTGSGSEPEHFPRVAGIFERRCIRCHNESDRKGSLSLESADGMAAGGDSGPVIKAGEPGASVLLDLLIGDVPEMPKGDKPLSNEEVAAIRDWIAAGAKWADGVRLRNRGLADTDWWSLKPILLPALPVLSSEDAARARTPVDYFILEKVREKKLRPAGEADRRTLLRRLYFDLVGLPPTPGDVAAFVQDSHPLAYEKLVDRLLASPRYGERWARHWLDVVHYGDTHGYDKDKLRPNAWPYRDYVIRAFNEDRPYHRFVQEQLAGDALWPDSRDGITATGFISAGPWDFIGHAELPESKIDGKIARHLDRDDMVATTMNTFVSTTVQCAQCHDHKFDPVSQEHYYSLQAVFAALDRADRQYEPDPAVGARRRQLQNQHEDLLSLQKSLEETARKSAGGELAEIERQLSELSRLSKSAEETPAYGYHSQIMTSPEETKWVQIDLGESTAIAQVVYVGCWDAFNNIFHGFGFPPRYKIEIADDPQFQTGVVALLDRTQDDVPNPGTQPQSISVGGRKARYIRFTATRLAPRLNDFIFALGELSVMNAEGVNLAHGKEVSALDSIEAPVRWQKKNLVDGYFYGIRSDPQVQASIHRLTARRDEMLSRSLDASLRNQFESTRRAIAAVKKQLADLPPPETVYCGCIHKGTGTFLGTGINDGRPREIRILARGNVQKPGELVGPGTVPILSHVDWRFSLPSGHSESDRRIALARWITRNDHPLTWRSLVNRIWQYHFGRGIVDSPSDFGRMGQQPTHPELLDWLAADFRDARQSIKDVHRALVLSSTYRQASSSSDSESQAIDADNQFLWRMNRRKLEAESIRDAVLLVSNVLDRAMYGPGFQDFVIERPEHSPHYEYQKYDPDDRRTHRRSIYRFLVRSQPQPFMDTLDCADPSQMVDKRNETLTALQALTLLNDRFVIRMSEHFAARLAHEHPDVDSQIEAAFHLALARSPTDHERGELKNYATQFGLPNTCRLLLNLNEFTFVD